MYTITLQRNGKYRCCGRMQADSCLWTSDTLDDAVVQMKNFAKRDHGANIRRRDIRFYRDEIVTVTSEHQVEWVPPKKKKALAYSI